MEGIMRALLGEWLLSCLTRRDATADPALVLPLRIILVSQHFLALD